MAICPICSEGGLVEMKRIVYFILNVIPVVVKWLITNRLNGTSLCLVYRKQRMLLIGRRGGSCEYKRSN